MSKVVQDTTRPPVIGAVTQFLTALPTPLTISLVTLSPYIHFVRWLFDVLSWKGTWDESWLLLAGWWGVCLGAEAVVRYLLPILALVAWSILTRLATRHTAQSSPATEDTLQQAIADLSAIQQILPTISSLLPSLPFTSPADNPLVSPGSPSLSQLLRILACIYPFYLLVTLTGVIRMRTLVAIAGSLLILHRAPFAVIIRRSLWRSAYFRWSVYWTWAKITGTPLPGGLRSVRSEATLSFANNEKRSTANTAELKAPSSANSIRFLFTVYENQRWWMGLDFTAALLPGERSSWCSRSLQPCSPPAAFNLPPPTTVYIPERSVKNGKGARMKEATGSTRVMKRTAVWRWDEPEWKVVVRKEGSSGNTRVERPLPSLVEEGASASAGRILRAAGKIRGASMDLSPEQRFKEVDTKDHAGAREGEKGGEKDKEVAAQGEEDEEPFTDPDGWIYGDNKWEGGSAKGGLGKYTRYRRWTRVAILSETVEWVDAADVPSEVKTARRLSGVPTLASPSDTQSHASSVVDSRADTIKSPVRKGTQDSIGSVSSHASAEQTGPSDEGSRLRQRLKAVVNGVAH